MKTSSLIRIVAGDITTFLLVTLYGFASHNELGVVGLSRVLATFLPLLVAWFLVAPHLGVYDAQRLQAARDLWRPFWAMVLAGPMAAWLRAMWLQSSVTPIFVIILGGFAALAIVTWRATYWFLVSRRA